MRHLRLIMDFRRWKPTKAWLDQPVLAMQCSNAALKKADVQPRCYTRKAEQ